MLRVIANASFVMGISKNIKFASLIFTIAIWTQAFAGMTSKKPVIRDTSVHASAALSAAFRTAMANGDAKTALRIAKQYGMGPFWITLYRDQLWYRLPQLLSAATACRENAYVHRGTPITEDEATICNRFVLDAADQLGDARGYFEALAWRRRHAAAQEKRGHPDAEFRPFYPKFDIAKLAASLPAYSVEVTSSAPVVLRYPGANRGASEDPSNKDAAFGDDGTGLSASFKPTIAMTINGHRVYAHVDSGQSQALVMSASESKALGLKRLVPGSAGFKLINKPIVPAGSTTLSLVRQLKLGTLRAHNVMAIVIPDSYGIEGRRDLAVGLPLLARFNNIAFNEASMVLNALPAPCLQPLLATYATAPGRGGLLVFDAKTGDRPIKVAMDTGSNVLLVAGRGLMPVAETIGITSNSDPNRAIDETMYRYLAVRVAKFDLSNDTTPILPGLAFPDALIGAPALAALDIRFTFTPRPSLCLARRSPARARADHLILPNRKKNYANLDLGKVVADERALPTPLSLSSDIGLIQSPSFQSIPMFHTPPLLKGMNMYPGRAIADRYVRPPPPWLHIHLYCVLYDGNVYVNGNVTGNFDRPVPDITTYFGRGDSAIGAFTSDASGRFDGVIALPGRPIAAPADVVRTPQQCASPKVKVGTPSSVKK